MKVMIVDDESNNRFVLGAILRQFYPDVDIVAEAACVSEAYELICALSPDLVFLDIQMPRENGFELLRKVGEVNFEVIFVTSFDKYAIDAIRFSALDYLLKPVDLNDLKAAMQRARKRILEKNTDTARISNLLDDLDGKQPRRIMVHNGDAVKLLTVSDVICITGDGSYSVVHALGHPDATVSKCLKDFESYFGRGSGFLRISKSQIINVNFIKQYSKNMPCVIELINGMLVEISRRKKTEVLSLLGRC